MLLLSFSLSYNVQVENQLGKHSLLTGKFQLDLIPNVSVYFSSTVYTRVSTYMKS